MVFLSKHLVIGTLLSASALAAPLLRLTTVGNLEARVIAGADYGLEHPVRSLSEGLAQRAPIPPDTDDRDAELRRARENVLSGPATTELLRAFREFNRMCREGTKTVQRVREAGNDLLTTLLPRYEEAVRQLEVAQGPNPEEHDVAMERGDGEHIRRRVEKTLRLIETMDESVFVTQARLNEAATRRTHGRTGRQVSPPGRSRQRGHDDESPKPPPGAAPAAR